jgi:hypothetical protein
LINLGYTRPVSPPQAQETESQVRATHSGSEFNFSGTKDETRSPSAVSTQHSGLSTQRSALAPYKSALEGDCQSESRVCKASMATAVSSPHIGGKFCLYKEATFKGLDRHHDLWRETHYIFIITLTPCHNTYKVELAFFWSTIRDKSQLRLLKTGEHYINNCVAPRKRSC